MGKLVLLLVLGGYTAGKLENGKKISGGVFFSFDCRYQGEISTTTDASPSIEERSLHWGGEGYLSFAFSNFSLLYFL